MAVIIYEELVAEAERLGVDPHRLLASRIFDVPVSEVTQEQRGAAKARAFALAYGVMRKP